jgi:hypothetical protein
MTAATSRLRRLLGLRCGQTLLLGSTTIPEQRQPQTAVFLPYLDERRRRAVTGRGGDVSAFWGLTASALEAMLRAAGFEVRERHPHRRSICLVCRAI